MNAMQQWQATCEVLRSYISKCEHQTADSLWMQQSGVCDNKLKNVK